MTTAPAQLKIAVGINDRTLPLVAGLVPVAGVAPEFVTAPLEEIFARAFDEEAYDVTELSFSNYLYLTARGESPYVGLPIFPSRAFRHSAIYIRNDRGITTPRDLIGRLVGVREYSMTAALVARGLLEDEYGVRSQDIRWRYGRADHKDSQPIARMQPRDVELEPIAADRTLSDMLRDGEIDAMVAYKPPPVFLEGHPAVRRLFTDVIALEQDYARRTGIFPIMHLMGVRRELANERPDLIVALCEAFDTARRYSFDKITESQALYSMHPWGAFAGETARAILGPDFWAYGLDANRPALEALCRYSFVQGIAPRFLSPEDLFAAPALSWHPPTP
jgi:4,5-dihydroxyphthalate decarboxylase